LLINIQDKDGEEILEDIVEIKHLEQTIFVTDKDGWCGIIDPGLYTLDVVMPEQYPKDLYLFGYEPKRPLYVTKIGGKHYLYLCLECAPYDQPIDMIIYKFTCHGIFGDQAEHIITTFWTPSTQKQSNTSSWRGEKFDNEYHTECYRVTLDGKDFPVKQEIFYSNRSEKDLEKIYNKELSPTSSLTASTAWITIDNGL
jgi:hypothetical protein